MRRATPPLRSRRIVAVAALAAAAFWSGCSDVSSSLSGPDVETSRASATLIQELGIRPALDAQQRHGNRLMAIPGVVGHGVGVGVDGEPTVVVFTVGPGTSGIPDRVDGVLTRTVASGMFVAGLIDETANIRPAPLGMSIGHPDITAGTLGFKVKNAAGDSYILSNNHVMANSNNATRGDNILQPGPYDGGSDPADKIGTLADFVDIKFDGSNNTVDAAIASIVSGDVLSHTGDEGYGQPSAVTALASPAMGVTKYGRTTETTNGTVDAINATVDVCYQTQGPFRCKQLARFVGQVVITPGSFSAGGDSGSGIVTAVGLNPVALLFAGSSSHTIASPIDAVLSAFNVTIDDGSGGIGNTSPTASFTFSCTDLDCAFDGSGSVDPGGSIVGWDWDFGEPSATGSGQTPDHTYAAGGNYTVTLTVTDNEGAIDEDSQTIAVTEPTTPATGEHVGDLEAGSQNNGSTWTALVTITVHDASHLPVAGFSVTGEWTGPGTGSGACATVTDESGQCTVTRTGIRKRDGSVEYAVTGESVTQDNHDSDGDSDGTTITVNKP